MRRYGTLLDILAKASALFKVIAIIGGIVLRPLTERKKRFVYNQLTDGNPIYSTNSYEHFLDLINL